jgi:hypothetical protein
MAADAQETRTPAEIRASFRALVAGAVKALEELVEEVDRENPDQ